MSDLVINGALIALVLALVGGTVKTVLFVSKMKEDLLAAMSAQVTVLTARLAEQEDAHQTRFEATQREHHEEVRTMRNDVATANQAMREKVNQFEIWARDEFVRKKSFEPIINRLEKGIAMLGDKIELRFDKLADRIEKIGHD